MPFSVYRCGRGCESLQQVGLTTVSTPFITSVIHSFIFATTTITTVPCIIFATTTTNALFPYFSPATSAGANALASKGHVSKCLVTPCLASERLEHRISRG